MRGGRLAAATLVAVIGGVFAATSPASAQAARAAQVARVPLPDPGDIVVARIDLGTIKKPKGKAPKLPKFKLLNVSALPSDALVLLDTSRVKVNKGRAVAVVVVSRPAASPARVRVGRLEGEAPPPGFDAFADLGIAGLGTVVWQMLSNAGQPVSLVSVIVWLHDVFAGTGASNYALGTPDSRLCPGEPGGIPVPSQRELQVMFSKNLSPGFKAFLMIEWAEKAGCLGKLLVPADVTPALGTGSTLVPPKDPPTGCFGNYWETERERQIRLAFLCDDRPMKALLIETKGAGITDFSEFATDCQLPTLPGIGPVIDCLVNLVPGQAVSGLVTLSSGAATTFTVNVSPDLATSFPFDLLSHTGGDCTGETTITRPATLRFDLTCPYGWTGWNIVLPGGLAAPTVKSVTSDGMACPPPAPPQPPATTELRCNGYVPRGVKAEAVVETVAPLPPDFVPPEEEVQPVDEQWFIPRGVHIG